MPNSDDQITMEARLGLFDDVFLEILLGLALALLIAIAFAPRLINLCTGFSTEIIEQYGSTGQLTTDLLQPTAVAAQSKLCKPGFVSWWKTGQWDVCALWALVVLFCIKLIHEPSVMRYHIRKVTGPVKDPGLLANVLMFFSRIVLFGTLYLFIIFTYIDGDGKVSDKYTSWAFFLLVLTSYTFPNVIRYVQLRRTFENTDNVTEWLTQVVAVWLALDIANAIALLVVVTWPLWPGLSSLLAIVLSICCIPVIIEFFSKAPKIITGKGSSWVRHIQQSSWWVRIVLCGAIILLPLAHLYLKVFRPEVFQAADLASVVNYSMLYLLFINVADWILNGRFFFGEPLSSLPSSSGTPPT